ncbi:hypothetical protein BD410DRAFT_873719 [Rickenella mellea]|uniref:Uncharacterized protein n=1 Tax=Rickenella mellea TaxID=50990 RepID=A0A4Y7PE50_9AGAM|nr:hypothetical protein BD410DRAFT_873719 [Rickenella mellea]
MDITCQCLDTLVHAVIQMDPPLELLSPLLKDLLLVLQTEEVLIKQCFRGYPIKDFLNIPLLQHYRQDQLDHALLGYETQVNEEENGLSLHPNAYATLYASLVALKSKWENRVQAANYKQLILPRWGVNNQSIKVWKPEEFEMLAVRFREDCEIFLGIIHETHLRESSLEGIYSPPPQGERNTSNLQTPISQVQASRVPFASGSSLANERRATPPHLSSTRASTSMPTSVPTTTAERGKRYLVAKKVSMMVEVQWILVNLEFIKVETIPSLEQLMLLKFWEDLDHLGITCLFRLLIQLQR